MIPPFNRIETAISLGKDVVGKILLVKMHRKLLIQKIFAVLATVATSYPTDWIDFLVDLNDFYQPQQIIAFSCFDEDHKLWFAEHLPITFCFEEFSSTINISESDATNAITFLVDLKCEDARRFVENAETVKYFRHPYRWILMGENLSQVPDIEALTDSNILFVENNYQLWTFYRIKSAMPYIIEQFGVWSRPRGLDLNQTTAILSRRRRNLHGVSLMATIVITHNDSMQHLDDYKEHHIDPIGKVNYILTKCLVESLNATLIYNRVATWGYRDRNSGNWSGMIGELATKRSDLGGTALFLQSDRIPVIEYLSMVTPTRAKFIFREPPLSYVTSIYLLPFTRLVWISIGCLITLAVAVIWLTLLVHQNRSLDESTWRISDCLLIGISAICQMGSILQPKSISARISTIFLLIALLFLYTSYTANIVALLQSTTKSITTLSDLLDSKLEVGVEDTPYNHYYFPASAEPVRRRLYEKKVLAPISGESSRFMNVSDGIDRVRRGLFAFHVELSVGYEVIKKTFYENEKCNLRGIEFLQVVDPWYAIQKNSPYKEMLKVSLFKIREHGIQARENAKIYTKKPVCTANGQSFGSVRLEECYVALVVLLIGFGVSFLILAVERIWKDSKICLM